jgi:Tol biopolymer transport system component
MRTLVFVLIALLAAACNGGGGGVPTATPAPQPSPVATPTATATLSTTPTATPSPVAAQTPPGPQQPVALEEGAHITESGAYLAELATGSLWRLGDQGGIWSPDGKAIASSGCCVGTGGLDVVDVPAGPTTRIFSGDIAGAAWSSDSQQIAFSCYANGPKGLYVINRDGSGLRLLSDMAGVWTFRWSPRGDRIAFDSDNHLYLLELASGEIADVADLAYAYAWSPDGIWLAFDNDSGLYLYEPDTGERRQLAVGQSGGPILWSPDGSRIAFPFGPRIAMTYGAYAYDPQAGQRLFQVVEVQRSAEPKPLPPARSPSWSPDATRIAYLSEGCITGQWDIFTVQPDGSSAKQLTDTPDSLKEGPVWSPTGPSIAFSTLDKLMLVDADSGQLRSLAVSDALATIGNPLQNSNWSPDGRYIAFFVGGAHGVCD